MALLHESVGNKKFDVRIIERNIQRGAVKEEDYQGFLKKLPDDSENAEWTSIEALAAEEDASKS